VLQNAAEIVLFCPLVYSSVYSYHLVYCAVES